MSKNVDIFDKFKTEAGYFGRFRLSGDNYYCAPILSASTAHRFRYHGRPTISWSLNNYLGLANHPNIRRAAERAVRKYGPSSPMGSRMLTGNTQYHLDLEEQIALFAQKESAYLFNYGYLGVLGTVCSMIGPNDTIIVDKLAHSCMIDAALLSQAVVRIYKHNNMDDLEHTLRRVNRKRKGGVLIVVEGVYGMTGDIANLKEITQLAQKYEARLFVDDAHGWGVMGETGVGSGEYYGVQDKIDLYFGTFAKSFASIGGMTASTREARDWIAFNARTQVFAKALPIIYVHALKKTLELVIRGDARRKKLWFISNTLKARMREIGYTVGMGDSPICSIFVAVKDRSPDTVGMQLVKWLRERGIFVSAVVYPVIPRNMLMFRIVPTAHHTIADIEQTIKVFVEMRDTFSVQSEVTGSELERLRRLYNPESSTNEPQDAPEA